MRTTVDRFGRVVVPKSMRVRLGLRAGTAIEIEIEEAGDHLCMRVAEDTTPLVMKEGILVFMGEAIGDLEDALAADRRERARRLAGMPSQ